MLNEELFNKICDYCGEAEGTVEIPDPNFSDEGGTWCVCKECKVCINEQKNLAALEFLKDFTERHHPDMDTSSMDEKIQNTNQRIEILGGSVIKISKKKN